MRHPTLNLTRVLRHPGNTGFQRTRPAGPSAYRAHESEDDTAVVEGSRGP
jgi:hypothetical protein